MFTICCWTQGGNCAGKPFLASGRLIIIIIIITIIIIIIHFLIIFIIDFIIDFIIIINFQQAAATREQPNITFSPSLRTTSSQAR